MAALEAVDAACQSQQGANQLVTAAPELLAAVCRRALASRGQSLPLASGRPIAIGVLGQFIQFMVLPPKHMNIHRLSSLVPWRDAVAWTCLCAARFQGPRLASRLPSTNEMI